MHKLKQRRTTALWRHSGSEWRASPHDQADNERDFERRRTAEYQSETGEANIADEYSARSRWRLNFRFKITPIWLKKTFCIILVTETIFINITLKNRFTILLFLKMFNIYSKKLWKRVWIRPTRSIIFKT